ncbi:SRPBCC family protein [Streptomyces sp. NPDC004031]
MATGQKNAETEQGPLAMLRHELGQYMSARTRRAARTVGTRLRDATDRVAQEEDGGTLPKVGSRVLHGESPAKALAEETVGGSASGVAGKIKSAVTPGDDSEDDDSGDGGGDAQTDTKATNIVEVIDVGVPLRTAYDHWTEYESFSGFAKAVQSAERGDDTTSEWMVKIGPSTRTWKATVQEQLPDDRIVWTTEGSSGTTQGAVSFHEITPTLTRIILVLVYSPTGFVEKTGNLWRAQGRRARLDFKNFQRYVTFADEEAEGWRGEIREGQVVRSHEEAMAEEEGELDEAEDDDEDEGDDDAEEADEDDD